MGDDVWKALSQAMRNEGVYHAPRLDPKFLRRQFNESRAIVLQEGIEGRIVGYAARLPTEDPDVDEIALIYVSPDRRRNGLLNTIMQSLIEGAPTRKELFLITRDPVVRRVAEEKYRFERTTLEQKENLLSWASRARLIDRLPRSATTPTDPDELGVRWLLIRPALLK
jgi:GNAT superfamily N-acetyltransferase